MNFPFLSFLDVQAGNEGYRHESFDGGPFLVLGMVLNSCRPAGVSAVGSLSSCTIQSPLQSSESLGTSDWALVARGGYEIDAWFAPLAPSLMLRDFRETAAGFAWCMSRWAPPSNRSIPPQCPTRFQRLDFHGARCAIVRRKRRASNFPQKVNGKPLENLLHPFFSHLFLFSAQAEQNSRGVYVHIKLL